MDLPVGHVIPTCL